jgi:hypothetical protein
MLDIQNFAAVEVSPPNVCMLVRREIMDTRTYCVGHKA